MLPCPRKRMIITYIRNASKRHPEHIWIEDKIGSFLFAGQFVLQPDVQYLPWENVYIASDCSKCVSSSPISIDIAVLGTINQSMSSRRYCSVRIFNYESNSHWCPYEQHISLHSNEMLTMCHFVCQFLSSFFVLSRTDPIQISCGMSSNPLKTPEADNIRSRAM